tara:strand:- start:123 stop:461 length:339 start_codon:yes stop_codon:yes gene_type:complete
MNWKNLILLNKTKKVMNIQINHKKPLDIEKLLNIPNPIHVTAEDYVDVLTFLFKYDLDMVCDILQLEIDGQTDVQTTMEYIRKTLKKDDLYLDTLVGEMSVLAVTIEPEALN